MFWPSHINFLLLFLHLFSTELLPTSEIILPLMARKNLHLGQCATCSALFKFIHPKPAINTHFVNITTRDQATDLVALRLNDVTCKGRTYKHHGQMRHFMFPSSMFHLNHTFNPPSPSGSQGSSGGTSETADDKERSKLMKLSSIQQEVVPRIFC